ncbi:hypothetical protein SASPL_122989 [Salvia splendens]|uniref:Retrotransposon gag domain-containing protein n=1 Tax=Salvia splendens TaxID=180675 RepID=A0A8X8XQC5_SALSN|nr:hypothetical protein SASPL_122989 [Salvia splendens]
MGIHQSTTIESSRSGKPRISPCFRGLSRTWNHDLVPQFAQHLTTKALWKSFITTFGVRADPMQVYDLDTKTGKVVQRNRTLEEYWTDLQDLWVNIESRKPCPYTCCEKGPVIYNKENETKKLYQFLRGLDDCYDRLRQELLKEMSEPTAESALGIMTQEEGRTHIWKPELNPAGIGPGFGEETPSKAGWWAGQVTTVEGISEKHFAPSNEVGKAATNNEGELGTIESFSLANEEMARVHDEKKVPAHLDQLGENKHNWEEVVIGEKGCIAKVS